MASSASSSSCDDVGGSSTAGSVEALLAWPDNKLFGVRMTPEELRVAMGPKIEDIECAKEAANSVAKRCSIFVRNENARPNKLSLNSTINAINLVSFFLQEYAESEDVLAIFVSKRKYIEPYTEALTNENNMLLLNFRELSAITSFLVKLVFPFCLTNFDKPFRGPITFSSVYSHFAPIVMYVLAEGSEKQRQKERIEENAFESGVAYERGKTLREVSSDLLERGISGGQYRDALDAARNYLLSLESDESLDLLVLEILFVSLIYFMELWSLFVEKQDDVAVFFNRTKDKAIVFRIITIMFCVNDAVIVAVKSLNAFDIATFIKSHPGDTKAVTDMYDMLKLIASRGVAPLVEVILSKAITSFAELYDMDGPQGKALSKGFFTIANSVDQVPAFKSPELLKFLTDVINSEDSKNAGITKKMGFFLKLLNIIIKRNTDEFTTEVFAKSGLPKVEFTPEKMNSFSYINFLVNTKVPIPRDAFASFSKVNTPRQVVKALKVFSKLPEMTTIFDKVVESLAFNLDLSGNHEKMFHKIRCLLARNPVLQDSVVATLDSALNSSNDYRKRTKIAERAGYIINGLYPEKAVLEKIVRYKDTRIVKDFFADVISKKVIPASKFADVFKTLLLVNGGDSILPFIRVLFCARPVPEDQVYLLKVLTLKSEYILAYPACVDVVVNVYAHCADPANTQLLSVAHDFLIEARPQGYSAELFALVDKLMDMFLGLSEVDSVPTIMAFAGNFFDSLFWMAVKRDDAKTFVYVTEFEKVMTSLKKLVRVFKAVAPEDPASIKPAALSIGCVVAQFMKSDADGTLDPDQLKYSPKMREIVSEIWASPSVLIALPDNFQLGVAYSVSSLFADPSNEASPDQCSKVVQKIFDEYLPLVVRNEKVWTLFHKVLCKFQEFSPGNADLCFDLICGKISCLVALLGSGSEDDCSKALSCLNACVFYLSSSLVFADKNGKTLKRGNATSVLRLLSQLLNAVTSNEHIKLLLSKSQETQNDLLDVASSAATSALVIAVGQGQAIVPPTEAVQDFSSTLMCGSVFPFPNPHIDSSAVADVVCSLFPALEHVGSDRGALLKKILELLDTMRTIDVPHLEAHLESILSVLAKCVCDGKSKGCYDDVVTLLTSLVWQPEDDAFNLTYRIARNFKEEGGDFDLFKCYKEFGSFKKSDPRTLFLATKYSFALSPGEQDSWILNPHIAANRVRLLSEDGLHAEEFQAKLFVFNRLAQMSSDASDPRSEFASRVLASLLLRVPVLQYYASSVYSGDAVTRAFSCFFQHRGVSFNVSEVSGFLSKYTMGTAFLQKMLAQTYCYLLDSFISADGSDRIEESESVPLSFLSLSETIACLIHFVGDPYEKADFIRILADNHVLHKLCSKVIARIDFSHFKAVPQRDPLSAVFLLVYSVVQAMTPKIEDEKFLQQWDISIKVQEQRLKGQLEEILMRFMEPSRSRSDEISPSSFSGFVSWVTNNMERGGRNEEEDSVQGPHDLLLLSRIENSAGSDEGESNEWLQTQRVRVREMNDEFSPQEVPPVEYDLSFECPFQSAMLLDEKGSYGTILYRFISEYLASREAGTENEDTNTNADINTIVSALSPEAQKSVLQVKGPGILKALVDSALDVIGVDNNSPAKIDGADTSLRVTATAIIVQKALSSPEVIVPLLRMLYVTDECFPSDVVDSIISCIGRIPGLPSSIFDLLIALLFTSFKACDNVSNDELQETVSVFLRRKGAYLEPFADFPLFNLLLKSRAVISRGGAVFGSFGDSDDITIYGAQYDGAPDFTGQVVARMFGTMRSMIMDKDKGMALSSKQASMFVSVMSVLISKFYSALSVEARARMIAFLSAFASYIKTDYETAFMMPKPAVDCLVEISTKFTILPELVNAHFEILRSVSKNKDVASYIEEAFYAQCGSAVDEVLVALHKFNKDLNNVLESDNVYKTKSLIYYVSNLTIGAKLSKLLVAMCAVFIDKNKAEQTDTNEFSYKFTEPAKAMVDRFMPVLEESMTLLDKLCSKKTGWPEGETGNMYFGCAVNSISAAILVALNRLAVDVKTTDEEDDETSERLVIDDADNEKNDRGGDVDVKDNEGSEDDDKVEGKENGGNDSVEKEEDMTGSTAENESAKESEHDENNDETERMEDEEERENDKKGRDCMGSNSVGDVNNDEGPSVTPDSGDLFDSFCSRHSVTINKSLKADPNLISKAFYPLICLMPSILNFESKQLWFRNEIAALKKDVEKQKEKAVEIKVRRESILRDSFEEFGQKLKDLKRPIKVVFDGEEATDAGGPRREWYQELSRAIADPRSGLFTLADNGAMQPNPLSGSLNPLHLEYFRFVGLLVGKALWDGETIDLHFVHSFYKRILCKPSTLHDMEAKDHKYYESLMELLKTPGAEDLSLNFTVQLNDKGATRVIPLVPNGENIEVNDQNKKKYVELVVEFDLIKSTLAQTRVFLKGFREFIPRRLVKPFTETQLELLISGLPVIDVEDLRRNTIYINGYTPTSDVVVWFWRAFESYNGEEKAMLLQFITGSGKTPAGGFEVLRSTRSGPVKISRSGSTDSLPTTHTCFNQIDIPPYESYEKLNEKLTMAIYCGYKGFGFI